MTPDTNNINRGSKLGEGHKTLVCLPIYLHKPVMQSIAFGSLNLNTHSFTISTIRASPVRYLTA